MMMILSFLFLNCAVLFAAMVVELLLCKLRRSFELTPIRCSVWRFGFVGERRSTPLCGWKTGKGAVAFVLVGSCAALGVLALWLLPLGLRRGFCPVQCHPARLSTLSNLLVAWAMAFPWVWNPVGAVFIVGRDPHLMRPGLPRRHQLARTSQTG